LLSVSSELLFARLHDRPGSKSNGIGLGRRLSGLPSIAGVLLRCRELPVGANRRSLAAQQTAPLFDDLVGAQQDRGRQGQAEKLGGLKIDDHFELGRLLDR